MSYLPIVDYKTLDRILQRIGFSVIRQKGSHVYYRHPDSRTTTVPNRPGLDISKKLLRTILREINLKPDQFKLFLED